MLTSSHCFCLSFSAFSIRILALWAHNSSRKRHGIGLRATSVSRAQHSTQQRLQIILVFHHYVNCLTVTYLQLGPIRPVISSAGGASCTLACPQTYPPTSCFLRKWCCSKHVLGLEHSKKRLMMNLQSQWRKEKTLKHHPKTCCL